MGILAAAWQYVCSTDVGPARVAPSFGDATMTGAIILGFLYFYFYSVGRPVACAARRRHADDDITKTVVSNWRRGGATFRCVHAISGNRSTNLSGQHEHHLVLPPATAKAPSPRCNKSWIQQHR